MESFTLDQQILSFVRSVNIVEEQQIIKFFLVWGKKNVEYELNRLLNDHKLFKGNNIPAGLISAYRTIQQSPNDYTDVIRALNIVTSLYKSDDIKSIFVEKYPNTLFFVTTDEVLYDIVIMDSFSWAQKFYTLKKVRPSFLPDPENDPCNHLAIIDSPEIIPKIRSLNFALYLTVDRNGHVSVIEDDV